MQEFFEKLRTIGDIQELIDDCERESEVLEYKRAGRKFNDKEEDEIGKDLSAMANSSGGVVIYGVGTDPNDKTRPSSIDGLLAVNIETFDRVKNTRIQPLIKGIRTKVIPNEQPRVMIVYVPTSEDTPHQNLTDNKYSGQSSATI